MKRLFIAIKIDPDPGFLACFFEFRRALQRERIKWVEERNIHITVKFLGETDEKRIPAIMETMERLAGSTHDFTFRLSGLGIFGSSYNPRVIWVGIHPYNELATLLKLARAEFEALGFEADRQNLVPHLTLGRVRFLKDAAGFQHALERYRAISSRPLAASRLVLFESTLLPSGPEYHALSVRSLKKVPRPLSNQGDNG